VSGLKRGQESPRSPKNGTTGKLQSTEKAVAKQFDVSHGYVYAAQKIKDKDEKVFQHG
jgi:hypothetical protein